ncbi:hypothetical protein DFS33DRAFT_1274503 [Desarmillaria ectypa]|nr:hypothetical protein DFS33DRAFT_1274503 [Desarmillaria ectypa]
MSPVSTKRVHWEDDFSRYAAPSPFYVTFLVSPTPPTHQLPHSPAWSLSSPRHRISSAPRPCLRPPSPFHPSPQQRRSQRHTSMQLPRPSTAPRASSPFPRPRRHSVSHPHTGGSPYASNRSPLPSARLSVHRALRLGTCQPIDFFSSSRIVPHPHAASEPASNPPLGRVFILVEIDRVERFNVEVYAGGRGVVTVHDVLARVQTVLRERLEPGVAGGCYKERCGCGCEALVDKRFGFTTMFDGLSVRSNGDQNKWRMHLRRVSSSSIIVVAPKDTSMSSALERIYQEITRCIDRHCENGHAYASSNTSDEGWTLRGAGTSNVTRITPPSPFLSHVPIPKFELAPTESRSCRTLTPPMGDEKSSVPEITSKLALALRRRDQITKGILSRRQNKARPRGGRPRIDGPQLPVVDNTSLVDQNIKNQRGTRASWMSSQSNPDPSTWILHKEGPRSQLFLLAEQYPYLPPDPKSKHGIMPNVLRRCSVFFRLARSIVVVLVEHRSSIIEDLSGKEGT